MYHIYLEAKSQTTKKLKEKEKKNAKVRKERNKE